MKRNRYSRALKHLKSTELDEKLQRLEETPTNNIGGVYSLNPPGFRVGIPDPPKVYYPDADGNWPAGIPGTPGELSYTRPEGYWSGGSDWNEQISTDFTQNYLLEDPTGRSTKGLIADDGTVLAQLPPGGQSFILGPIVDGYVYNHGYDDYTNIGYIQKDTRQFVLLARIQGHWSSDLRPSGRTPRAWNGTAGQLTIYNQNFTLAMTEWIRDEILANKYTSNVPYFYSGGVPQVPQSAADCPDCPPGMYGGNGVGGRPFGQGGNPNIGSRQGDPTKGNPKDAGYPAWDKPTPPDIYGDLLILGLSAVAAAALLKAIGVAGVAALARAARAAQAAKEWWNKGRNQRIPDENNASWRELFRDDWAQRGRTSDPNANPNAPWDPTRGLRPGVKADQGGFGSGPTPLGRQVVERPIRSILGQSYEMNGNFISEEVGDDLIDAIENALLQTKTLGQFLGVLDKVIEAIEKRSSTKQVKESMEILIKSRKRILREIKQPYKLPEIPKQKYKMNFKGKFTSQNTPDVTASKKSDDMVKAQNSAGQAWRTNDKYWKGYETTERMNIIYDNVGHGSQYWDAIINENQRKKGWRDREVQEHLNLIAHEKAMIKENPQYQSPFQIEIEEQETMKYDKDPLFKKVAQRLRKEIDYPDKPSANGYPNNPPPEQLNGWHPEYGERDSYYNRLDPQSANAMPPTRNPKIDAKVERAKRIKKIIGKKA